MSDPVQRCARAQQALDLGALTHEVGTRAARGGVVAVLAQGATAAIQLVSAATLARLIHPESFGVYGMVTAVTVLLWMFVDLGLSAATTQAEHLTDEQVNGLFWLNTAVGLLVAGLGMALAPAVAWFFGEPRCLSLMIAMSLTFPASGLATQHSALLRRQMRFGVLWASNVIGILVSVGCAILLAAWGAQYWALASMSLAQAGVALAFSWWACRWRPHWPPRFGQVGSMVRFGLHLAGAQGLDYVATNIDNVLIGRLWGPVALGYYGRAYGLFNSLIAKLTSPVMGIAVPALSRLQDDPERFRSGYRQGVRVLLWLNTPLVLTAVFASQEIVLVLLGSTWAPAAVPFRYFAFGAFTGPLLTSFGWVYTGMGRSREMLRWSLLRAVILIAAVLVGLAWGPNGVALGTSCANVLGCTAGALLMMRWECIRAGDLRMALAWPAVAAVVAVGLWYFAEGIIPAEQVLLPGTAILRLGMALITAGLPFAASALISGDAAAMLRRLSKR